MKPKIIKFKPKKQQKSGDFILIFIVIALVVFGVIMVFSSSYYDALDKKGDAFYYLKKDIVWAVIGFALMTLASLFPYRAYSRIYPVILGISLVLLALIFTPLGLELNNSVRWLSLGPATIMPGEIAKLGVIISVAGYLSNEPTRIKSLKRGVLPLFGLILTVCGLIILQPNLSTAITIGTIIIGIMFVAGLHPGYVITLGGAGIGGILFLIFSDTGSYWHKRFTTFLDPFADPRGDGWQVVQSLLALGSGGLFGVGLGKSIQKTLYLPEPQNDFIFAIIGEELGFVGCAVLIAAFMILVWRGIHIALNAPDLLGTLLASGITIMVAVQVILNIAVVTSSMPPTGIGLPFISWGGNALLIFMTSMGILLNISRNTVKQVKV
jgi:cell division protein FtsW